MDPITAREVVSDLPGPKVLTVSELRKLRKLYVTIRHPRVLACDHRLSPNHTPRMKNCRHCWMAFFDTHPELLNTIDKLVAEAGLDALAQFHGRKAVKYFGLYNVTVRPNGKSTS